MSSPSEAARRWAAASLLTAVMAASALVYRGVTPLEGAPSTPHELSDPVDRAVARLSTATRPLAQVTACAALRAYLPDHLPWSSLDESIGGAPPRPVILCLADAPDAAAAAARARREGLTWMRGIEGSEVVAYARDEAGFSAAMAQAGVAIPPTALRQASPTMLSSLRSDAPGVRRDRGGWRVPAHADDRVILFGPYVDLAPGAYRVRLHATLQGSADRCRAAAAFAPFLGVTRDAGAGAVQGPRAATVTPDPGDPCSLSFSDVFALGAAAHQVETPFRASSALPYVIDGYALEPASAQAR